MQWQYSPQIKFEYIKSIKNTLSDTMHRLITIGPSIQLDQKPKGHEFVYYIFDLLLT